MSEPTIPIGREVVVIGGKRSDLLTGLRGTVLSYHEGGYVVDFPAVTRTGLFGGGQYKEPSISWVEVGDIQELPIVNDTNPT